ncbi:hypothetical protein GGQ80_001049 [Sphingomonas jinjuensis]|uniref:Class I SAM-dependent methyltransferase n=1 Tax=Sphingomonas jinjuensis TaxID=535907 RepID=A0A840F9A0_9SPHN|nr:class I SAM-dependent methyltransferase [Sphingomonas jinjuensis]MBB4153161.1 hypothetical protein [Sphingomonas jinjuensis]
MTSSNPVSLDALPPSMFWTPEDFRPSSWLGHIPFAFWIVDALRPRSIVELGTWHGMSYLAFCQAVKTLGLDTWTVAVDTWQGDHQAGSLDPEAYTSLRAAHDPKYSAFSRLLRCTFDEALNQVEDGSVDLLHIDGLHTYDAVKHDFESWFPKLSDRAVVLFHDTYETHADFGVHRFWAEVAASYPHLEFHHEHGLGVLGVGANLPDTVRSLLTDATRQDAARAAFSRLGEGFERRQVENELRGKLRYIRNRRLMRWGRTVREKVLRRPSTAME